MLVFNSSKMVFGSNIATMLFILIITLVYTIYIPDSNISLQTVT